MRIVFFSLLSFSSAMSALRAYRPNYTVADYQQWEGSWELWDGTPVAMAPSPFGHHAALIVRLTTQLSNQIEAHRCEAEVLCEIDWIVSDRTVVRPDVLVSCDGIPPRHVETAPTTVAEVLSDSTRARDLRFKRDLYRAEGVTTYLALEPADATLTCFGGEIDVDWNGKAISGSLRIDICENSTVDIDTVKLFRGF